MKRFADHERPQGCCYDCGLSYRDPGWIEAVVPDVVWSIINPTYHETAGLLCINCISSRCAEAGLVNVPVAFSGMEPLRPVVYDEFHPSSDYQPEYATSSS